MTDLQWLVDEACLQLPREKRQRTGWWASQLGMCPSGQYFERQGLDPDKPLDARTMRIFKLGEMFEEFTDDILQLSPAIKHIDRQTRIENKDLHVTGKIDFTLTYQDGKKCVVEVKSKNSMAFWKMLDRYKGRGDNRVWTHGEGANEHHLMQTWMYLKETGIEDGMILYISKDDLVVHVFPVSLYDKELENKTMERINLLNSAWEAQTPPMPMSDVPATIVNKDGSTTTKMVPHWTARYCNHHRRCLELLRGQRLLHG